MSLFLAGDLNEWLLSCTDVFDDVVLFLSMGDKETDKFVSNSDKVDGEFLFELDIASLDVY